MKLALILRRTDGFALVVVRAIAETLGVHLRDHLQHPVSALWIAPAEARRGAQPSRK
jgi:hypothetical protein